MIEVFRAAMVSSIVCAATGALAATDVDAMAMGVNVSFDAESNSVAFENDSTCNIQGYVVEFDMVLESASRFERERALAGPFQKNYVIVWSDLMTLAQYKLHNRTFGVTSNFRIVPNGYRASELQITRVSAIGSVPATFLELNRHFKRVVSEVVQQIGSLPVRWKRPNLQPLKSVML